MKYLTYQQLDELNRKAMMKGYSRTVVMEQLPITCTSLFPILQCVVAGSALVDSRRLLARCRIVLNNQADIAYLDMTLGDYEQLDDWHQSEQATTEAAQEFSSPNEDYYEPPEEANWYELPT